MHTQMASIENQQRAIESLQSNLKADLDSKGVLSDPDCQKVLLLHQQVSAMLLSRDHKLIPRLHGAKMI